MNTMSESGNRLDGSNCNWCNDPRHVRPSRRNLMYVGLVGGLGLTLGKYFGMTGNLAKAEQKFYESKEGVAKSVIHIFLPGGMAQQESFDPKPFAPIAYRGPLRTTPPPLPRGAMAQQESFAPKPFAPIEYRGPFGTIPTALTGEVFSENVPGIAKIADKITVVRSMTHGQPAHDRATHTTFTGSRPSPAVNYPSMGSVVAHEFGPR